jgi:DNA-binding transcriptional regulator YiaG
MAEWKNIKFVPRVTTMRKVMRLSLEEFGQRFDLPLTVLKDWEASRSEPDQVGKIYLRVIAGGYEDR